MHMANKEYEANEARLIDTKDDPNLGKRRTADGEVIEPPCYLSYSKKHKHACLHKTNGCHRRPHWEIKNFTWEYGDEPLQFDQYCKDCWKKGAKPDVANDKEPGAGGRAKVAEEEREEEAMALSSCRRRRPAAAAAPGRVRVRAEVRNAHSAMRLYYTD